MECSARKGRIIGRNRVRVEAQSRGRRRIRSRSSQQPAFGEGHRAGSCGYEMVERLYVGQSERAFQRAGEALVGMARLGVAGGVVMRENHRRRVMLERALHDLARVDMRYTTLVHLQR